MAEVKVCKNEKCENEVVGRVEGIVAHRLAERNQHGGIAQRSGAGHARRAIDGNRTTTGCDGSGKGVDVAVRRNNRRATTDVGGVDRHDSVALADLRGGSQLYKTMLGTDELHVGHWQSIAILILDAITAVLLAPYLQG